MNMPGSLYNPPMRKPMKPSLLAFLCVAFLAARPVSAVPGALSQRIMTVWTDREGLPSNTILDVVQDRAGYIWLASYDGLVRFDGEAFTTFGVEDGGFDGRSARVLAVGADGTLWIGSNAAGLYAYRDGRFRRYGLSEGLPDLSLRSIAFSSDGTVWVGTAGGVARMVGDRFQAVGEPGVVGIANFVLPLPDGKVLAGSNLPGLRVFGTKGMEPYLPGQGLDAHAFSAALLDGSGRLWLGTSSGRVFLVRRNEVVELAGLAALNGASVNAFLADADGTLWIASDRGVVSMRGEQDPSSSFTEANGLPSNVVSSLWLDRERNLWAGTERGGLVKFSPGKFINLDRGEGLVSDAVNAVTEDAYRSLWVATDEGVSFFPSDADPYRGDPARTAAVDAVVASLRGVRVRQVRAEADGSLWFATYSPRGLLSLGADGLTRSMAKAEGLPNDRVRFSYRAPSGALWIGTTAGPATLAGGRLRSLGIDEGLPNLFILCALEDRAGRVWLGTDGGGVAALTPGAERVDRVYTKTDGLAGNVVFRILEDAAGRLWFCTSEGLSLYADGVFRSADTAAGLAGESVFEILEDGQGHVWIVTGRKAIVVDTDELAAAALEGSKAASLRAYDRLDGLAGQLSANAWSYVNDRGVVYLPTLKGLSTFNPQSASVNTLAPPVIIEGVDVDGVSVTDFPLSVAAGARRLTFRYTALSYTIPQRVRFQCMLEGYDADWITVGTARDLGYTNLPPGEYVFRVRATNNDGVVNEEGAQVSLRKEPFFYQTIPFYAALAAALVGVGFLASYLRVARLRRRAAELDALVKERTRELADEKEKSDGLLRNVLPPSVAEELKRSGYARPRVYGEATVLFADIVGFTEWSAGLAPDAVIEELNALFTGFDDIMDRWGCERVKTIGDGYLACSGLDEGACDHAARMTRAGIDMLRLVESRGGGHGLRIRVGVDSGPIVGGVVGVKKYIFDVFGDTVNTAFRLEAMSAPMGLTVSEATAERLGDEFELLRRPGRRVKGKGVMTSRYVVYRAGPGAALPYREAKDRVEALAALARDAGAGNPGAAEALRRAAEAIEPTTLEPELAADLEALLASS